MEQELREKTNKPIFDFPRGRCKKEFEEWFNNFPNGRLFIKELDKFYELPLVLSWSIYVEFFESKGLDAIKLFTDLEGTFEEDTTQTIIPIIIDTLLALESQFNNKDRLIWFTSMVNKPVYMGVRDCEECNNDNPEKIHISDNYHAKLLYNWEKASRLGLSNSEKRFFSSKQEAINFSNNKNK